MRPAICAAAWAATGKLSRIRAAVPSTRRGHHRDAHRHSDGIGDAAPANRLRARDVLERNPEILSIRGIRECAKSGRGYDEDDAGIAQESQEPNQARACRPTTLRPLRLRQYAYISRLDCAFPHLRGSFRAKCPLRLRHTRNADDGSARKRLDRNLRRGRNRARSLRPRGDFARTVRSGESRRSHPGHQFRLSPDSQPLQRPAHAHGSRDDLLRSVDRRRHRKPRYGRTRASSFSNRPARKVSKFRMFRRLSRSPRPKVSAPFSTIRGRRRFFFRPTRMA